MRHRRLKSEQLLPPRLADVDVESRRQMLTDENMKTKQQTKSSRAEEAPAKVLSWERPPSIPEPT